MSDGISDELTVRTGGRILGGWTEVSVERGVEQLPSSFSVVTTERYPSQVQDIVADPGAPCEIWLGADKILTGYIDGDGPRLDASEHMVTLAGRSKTEDLVDCSLYPADFKTQNWQINAATMSAAAKYICDPFGISVVMPDGDRPLDQRVPFVIEPGMTAFQMIEELARSVQLLVWDDANGNLVLSAVGATRAATALVEGANCEAEEARLSMNERFSDVWVIGQLPLVDASGSSPQTYMNQLGHTKDPDVPRYRPKLIVIDHIGVNLKYAQQRADWEVARRMGRSRQVAVDVTGWRDGGGTLWAPNTLVTCNLPSMKIAATMLIAKCTWKRGEGGTTTRLLCMPPQGMMPAPFLYIPPIPGATTPAN